MACSGYSAFDMDKLNFISITKNANQTSKTSFKKMQNLNLVAMKLQKKPSIKTRLK